MGKDKSHVELDLFGLHNNNPLAQSQSPRLDRRQSFRGISKMNPEIVKTVIASSMQHQHVTPPPTPSTQTDAFPLSVSGPNTLQNPPMTIFYNGLVSVFDLPKDKAEFLIKLAMERNISINTNGNIVDHSSFASDTTDQDICGSLNDGDMPIKRKKSLQRFFEKRKERLISVSPYASMDHVVPGLNQPKD